MGKRTDNRMLQASIETLLRQNKKLKEQIAKNAAAANYMSRNEQEDTQDQKHNAAATDARMTDILHLNVGGTEMFASRHTLTTIEGSNLALLFNGDMDDQLLRDGKGRIFMDLDPLVFGKVIEFLQASKLSRQQNKTDNDNDNVDSSGDDAMVHDSMLTPTMLKDRSDGGNEVLEAYMSFFGLVQGKESHEESENIPAPPEQQHFLSFFIRQEPQKQGEEEDDKGARAHEASTSEHDSINSESDEYYFPEDNDGQEEEDTNNDHNKEEHDGSKRVPDLHPEILTLYINGDIMAVRRSTLCLLDSSSPSKLACDFGDDEWLKRHVVTLENGEDCVLVDYPFFAFRRMVCQLRLKAMMTMGEQKYSAPVLCIEDDFERECMTNMLKHFLSDHESLIRISSAEMESVIVDKKADESCCLIPSVEMESVIIDKKADEKKILKWLVSANRTSKPKLLFRASRDGWDAKDFHKCCDGKGATLTVVKSEGEYVFGGYTDVSWSSSEGYKTSSASFLFSLKCAAGLGAVQMKVLNQVYAVRHSQNHGPTFGGGRDLYIASNANADTSSYSNFAGHYYAMPAGATDKYFLAGTRTFKVAEYEVFQV